MTRTAGVGERSPRPVEVGGGRVALAQTTRVFVPPSKPHLLLCCALRPSVLLPSPDVPVIELLQSRIAFLKASRGHDTLSLFPSPAHGRRRRRQPALRVVAWFSRRALRTPALERTVFSGDGKEGPFVSAIRSRHDTTCAKRRRSAHSQWHTTVAITLTRCLRTSITFSDSLAANIAYHYSGHSRANAPLRF
jgi:hypothetical protein